MHIYWTMLILFTFLGLLIGGTTLYVLVLVPWHRNRKEKMLEKKSPKREKKKKNKNKNTDPWYVNLVTIVIGIPFVFGLFVALPVFCLWYAYPYWVDLPRVLTGNYEELSGTLNNISKPAPNTKGWGYPYYITIDDKLYESIVEIDGTIGSDIIVEILPNTEVVVDIKEVN